MIGYLLADYHQPNGRQATPDIHSWRGIYPALCTPFHEDDSVDVDAQRQVVRFAIDAGAHGLVAFGLAGEVLKLSADERKLLTSVIVEETDDRVPLFVGVGAESVSVACELAAYAEEAGASCVVLPAPLSARLGGDALVDYFVRIAERVSVPVMIQDAPAYLGQAVGPGTVLRAAEQAPNVRLVKLEAGPAELSRWIADLGAEFAVWGGDAGMYQLDCLRNGAAGIIPGVDLVDLLVEIYEAECSGDSALADELFRRVLPMLVFEIQLSIDHFNACAKHVLVRRGVVRNGRLREPAPPFGDVSLRLLEAHLAALDLADVRARTAS
jgi:dihydrodipicolinate synthase/N-acetylneuraminate lyase